jgi:hypothetical protein
VCATSARANAGIRSRASGSYVFGWAPLAAAGPKLVIIVTIFPPSELRVNVADTQRFFHEAHLLSEGEPALAR